MGSPPTDPASAGEVFRPGASAPEERPSGTGRRVAAYPELRGVPPPENCSKMIPSFSFVRSGAWY